MPCLHSEVWLCQVDNISVFKLTEVFSKFLDIFFFFWPLRHHVISMSLYLVQIDGESGNCWKNTCSQYIVYVGVSGEGVVV